MNIKSTRSVGLVAVFAVLALTACGSTSTDGSAPEANSSTEAASSSAAEAPAESAAEAPAEAANPCTEEAAAAVEAARAPLDVKGPSSPVDMKENAGKSLWLISAGQTEFTQSVADGFVQAAESVGMSAKYVQAKGQVTVMQNLVDQAVAAKADGIVLFNIPPEAVQAQLEKATEAGVTVIDFNNGDPGDPLQPGIFAHVASTFSDDGKKTADWMMADSDCQVNMATFTIPVVNVVELMINGAIDQLAAKCPTCMVTESEFSYATFATALGPQADTVMRRDPGINYINPAADAFASVISPVLEASGLTVKITGHDGNSSNLKAMAEGNTLQAMTVAAPPADYTGWALVDQLGRGMLGMPSADWALPGRIIDSQNIGDGSNAVVYPGFEDFPNLFTVAWGQ